VLTSDSQINMATRVPFYRDVKVLAVIAQVVFVLLVALTIWILGQNLNTNLKTRNLSTSFEFLGRTAGFQVAEGSAFGVPFSSEDSYLKAITVGLYNTLRVSILGIVLATILGVVVGVARLSSNWLVNRIAVIYVEVFRNTPLLVQLIFWYFAGVLTLPKVKEAAQFGGAYLSNQGFFMPWLVQKPDSISFFPVWIVAIVLAVATFVFLERRRVNLGSNEPAGWIAIGVLFIVLVSGYFVLGQPLELDMPRTTNFGIAGGASLSPEFAALLIGLVVYTASFIAETVRAGIQAVNKGQWEAARAIGMSYTQTLQLIVLPQALRVIIPPLGNQYLNLTKNSSLATAIGFPDMFNVLNTAGNQSGFNLQTMLIALLVYLVLSLTISSFVNLYNRATRLKTR
jgi:general L-amino acid transport system permease protein